MLADLEYPEGLPTKAKVKVSALVVSHMHASAMDTDLPACRAGPVLLFSLVTELVVIDV